MGIRYDTSRDLYSSIKSDHRSQNPCFRSLCCHDEGLFIYSLICMVISVYELFSICNIQKNCYFQNEARKASYHTYRRILGRHYERCPVTLFEFDIEQDALRKPLLIKQETEWNKLDDLAPFC